MDALASCFLLFALSGIVSQWWSPWLLEDPVSKDDAPNVADDGPAEEELKESEEESGSSELASVAASSDHGSNARCDWDAVEDEADKTHSLINLHNSSLACAFLAHFCI